MTADEFAIATLKKCRDQFQFYGDAHLAKDPPQVDKAVVNYGVAAEVNAVLIQIGQESVRLPDTPVLNPAMIVDTIVEARHFADTLRGRDPDDMITAAMPLRLYRYLVAVDPEVPPPA